jgi:predicted DNA-binding transcriptional regulator YafY
MSQTERIFFIDRSIRRDGGVRADEVTRRFEISSRQAKRDIEYLRDRLNAPINYFTKRRRYEYTRSYRDLEFADEKTFLFYIFTRSIARNLNYVPIVSEDLLEGIAENISKNYLAIADKIEYEINEFENCPLETIYAVFQSIQDRKQIRIEYVDIHGQKTDRTIEILKLINYAGRWYCVAFDHSVADIRIFLLARISRVVITNRDCEAVVPEETLHRYTGGSYGIYKGTEASTVILRFFEPAYGIVRHQIWHPSQTSRLGDDSIRGPWVELTLPVSHYPEILGKVLRYGAAGEVVGPPEFRGLWVEEIRKMGRLVDG